MALTFDTGDAMTLTMLEAWTALPEPKAAWSAVQGRWLLYANPAAPTPSNIPPGTSVVSNKLVGTPTTAGDYTVGIQYTTSTNVKTYYALDITIAAGEPLVYPDPPVANAGVLNLTMGLKYSPISVSHMRTLLNPTPVRPDDGQWRTRSSRSNVPTGMTLDYKSLFGKPTVAGDFSIGLWYSDGFGEETPAPLLVKVIDPDAEPEEPTEPTEPTEPSGFGMRVATLMGFEDDPEFVILATEQSAIIKALAKSYTRGGGFVAGEPLEDVAAVIVTASARLAANPEQIAYQVGAVAFRGGFEGWSLAELAVLNRYRKRFT